MNYSAILLSGGKGTRMQRSTPKQYLLLAGKPIIMHTLERLDKLSSVSEIIIVCENQYQEMILSMCKQYGIEKNIVFAPAGDTRQESVYNAVKLSNFPNVLLHEAARPFVTLSDFSALLNNSEKNVTYGYAIPYTVAVGNSKIEKTLDRSSLINIQLPQKFDTATLLNAHEKARKLGKLYTEDACMVFELTGSEITVMKGTSINLKISEPVDLITGEEIYKEFITTRK